jgi:hypothetical protein
VWESVRASGPIGDRRPTLTLHPEPLGATCFSVAIPIAARLDRVDAGRRRVPHCRSPLGRVAPT